MNVLKIISDDNIMEFVRKEFTKKKETIFVYRYTKSRTKKGMEVSFTEKELNNYIESKIFHEVQPA